MDLEDQLEKDYEREREGYPDAWMPENEGQMLIGTLIDYRENVDSGYNYGPSDVAEIEPDDGEVRAVWISSTVLRKQWEAANPMVGDEVGIIYLGERDSKGGMAYHNWSVRIERSDENERKLALRQQATKSKPVEAPSQPAEDDRDLQDMRERSNRQKELETQCETLAKLMTKSQAHASTTADKLLRWYEQKLECSITEASDAQLDSAFDHVAGQIEQTRQEMGEHEPQDPEFGDVDLDETEDDIPF